MRGTRRALRRALRVRPYCSQACARRTATRHQKRESLKRRRRRRGRNHAGLLVLQSDGVRCSRPAPTLACGSGASTYLWPEAGSGDAGGAALAGPPSPVYLYLRLHVVLLVCTCSLWLLWAVRPLERVGRIDFVSKQSSPSPCCVYATSAHSRRHNGHPAVWGHGRSLLDAPPCCPPHPFYTSRHAQRSTG